MGKGDDALDVLRSIDATLKAMLALAQQRTAQARASQPKTIATDRELDAKWGDPIVTFMPRDWSGPSFKGRHMSECPPELLDMLADTFDYFAKKADENNETTDKGKPVAGYKRADAGRARGWAKRMRDGRHVSPTATAGDESPDWQSGEQDGWS